MTGGEREPVEPPSLTDYMMAVQHPRLCFPDDDVLAASTTVLDALGPVTGSGVFGCVFRFTSEDGALTWAVKCFTSHSDARADRYRKICAALAELRPAEERWLVPMEFAPEGVLVGGRRWPLVKMPWRPAAPLLDWVERWKDNPAALRAVAADFTAVVGRLGELGIAHGDLQHGNILISAPRRVQLIDYDAMYVPALAGTARPERGHRNYQRPRPVGYGPRMDRFPARVIQLSLLGLAADAELWDRLREDDDRLLLGQEDFEDPGGSEALAALAESPDPQVRDIAARLLADLRSPHDLLPPLAAVVMEPTLTPVTPARTRPAPVRDTASEAPAGQPTGPRTDEARGGEPQQEPRPEAEPEPEPEPRPEPKPEPRTEPGPQPQPHRAPQPQPPQQPQSASSATAAPAAERPVRAAARSRSTRRTPVRRNRWLLRPGMLLCLFVLVLLLGLLVALFLVAPPW
ncbi:protein kinase family protein [Streptomyces lavendulocolor]